MRNHFKDTATRGAGYSVSWPEPLFARFAGTDAADTYLGTRRSDTIFGLGGNDTLAGAGGDDVIDGGDGNDSIAGDEGDDMLSGGAGDDVISSIDGADSVDGGGGFDRWIGNYGAVNDPLTFDEVGQSLSNGTTLAGIEAVILSSGRGDDSFVLTGERHTTIDAGGGTDTLTLDATQGAFGARRVRIFFDFDRAGDLSGIVGGLVDGTKQTIGFDFQNIEAVTAVGTNGGDRITFGLDRSGISRPVTIGGGAGNDKLTAIGPGHTIFGGTGDDTITTSEGGHTIDGGDGDDKWSTRVFGGIVYDQATQSFSDGTTLTSIERVFLYSVGSELALGNTFNLTNSGALYLSAIGVNDSVNVDLRGSADGLVFVGRVIDGIPDWALTFGDTEIRLDTESRTNRQIVALIGTQGDDTFTFDRAGNYFISSLDGADGLDMLTATLAADSDVVFTIDTAGAITSNFGDFANLERFDLMLGVGVNTVTTGAYDDRIVVTSGSTGANRLSGGGGSDIIVGARGADLLKGDDGDDTLTGNDGDDTLNGGAGDDMLSGGNGSDTAGYLGASSGVQVSVTTGAQDTGGAGTDTLSSIENLNGSAFDDRLTGDFFANRLRGYDGDDVIAGLDGNDYLEGGGGVDRLTGGAGSDTFAFTALTDFEADRRDRILDFSRAQGDLIDLSAIDPVRGGGDQAFTFIGNAGFTQNADTFEVRVQDQGGGAYLVQGDVNHDAVADFSIIVSSIAPLQAGDFIL